MSNFLEQYGKALFTLVLIAILIAFAGPLGMKIKNATTEKVSTTEEIGNDEVYTATTGRPKPPKEVNDYVYALLYDDGELVISGTEITPDKNRAIFTCSQGSGNFGKVRIYDNSSKKPSWPKWTYSMKSTSEFAKHVTSVNILNKIQPKSCYAWFYDFRNLTEIKNIENLYTDQCVSMKNMFSDCKSLINIDLHYFNTSQVTNMFYMFEYCQNLISLDVSGFDTSKVTDMYGMFAGCKSLKSLNLGRWNTSNVTNMQSMFYNCEKLTNLDLSGWDIRNVIMMSNIFQYASSLKVKSVKVSEPTYEKLKSQLSADKFDIVK